MKTKPHRRWVSKLGYVGFLGLLGLLTGNPSLYGFYGFFGFFAVAASDDRKEAQWARRWKECVK